MTRAEFQSLFERMSREFSRGARSALAAIRRCQAGQVSPLEVPSLLRQARAIHARALAAYDQYEAACRDVPASWLPPEED